MHSDRARQTMGNFFSTFYFHAFCNKFYDAFLYYEREIKMEQCD